MDSSRECELMLVLDLTMASGRSTATGKLWPLLSSRQLDSFEKFARLILVGHGRLLLKVLRHLQKKPNWPTFSSRR